MGQLPLQRDDEEEYPLVIRNNHLFIDLGHGPSVLLDTGADFSLGRVDAVIKPRPTDELSEGLRDMLSQASDFIGYGITGLVGLDWLSRRGFTIDLRHHGEFKLRRFGPVRPANIPKAMQSLCVDVLVNNVPFKAFVDTGAPTSYLSRLPQPSDSHPVASEDFTFLRRRFETFHVDLHRLPVSLGSEGSATHLIHLAQAPIQVIDALTGGHFNAILGLEFLQGGLLSWSPEDGLSITHPTSHVDDQDDPVPMPLPESLQNFWDIVADRAGIERRRIRLVDGASMLLVAHEGSETGAIRCDLEVAIAGDGGEAVLAALAKVHTDLGHTDADIVRQALWRQSTTLHKLFNECLSEGCEILMASSRADWELKDDLLLEPFFAIDLRFGARVTLQKAFTFSLEFRENSPDDTRDMAKAVKALDQLLRQLAPR